jgi:hypothetical protein
MSRACSPCDCRPFRLDFRLGHQRRHRVDDDDIHRARTDQDLDDLQRLLAGVGLRHQQVLHVHAQLPRVLHVQGMLRVHVRGHAAGLLHVGNEVETERRLARGLRPVDLADATPRDAAHPDGRIEVDGAGGNHGDLLARRIGAHAHDRPLAELLFDLGDGKGERLAPVGFEPGLISGHSSLYMSGVF